MDLSLDWPISNNQKVSLLDGWKSFKNLTLPFHTVQGRDMQMQIRCLDDHAHSVGEIAMRIPLDYLFHPPLTALLLS